MKTWILSAVVAMFAIVGIVSGQTLSPQGLTLRRMSGIATIEWNANPDDGTPGQIVDHYTLYYSQLPNDPAAQSVDVGKVTSFVFTIPDPTKGYYFRLKAVNAAGGASVFSEEIMSTPVVTPPPPPGCVFTFGIPSTVLSAAGGSGTAQLTASDATCAWIATTSDPWLTVAPDSGTGSKQLTYAASANGGSLRMADLIAPSVRVSITQAAQPPPPTVCTYQLVGTQNFPKSGGTGSISVTTAIGCSWTVTDDAGWIATSPAIGSGPLTLKTTIGRYSGKGIRSGHVTIGGQMITIQQVGTGGR